MFRLNKIGCVTPKSSKDIKSSIFGVGFEKLDRDIFDPEKAYDKVADLGVKWIRLLSGWEKTEKKKGVYDFSWIEKIIDNILKRDMIPWVCLSYGNKLYSKDAENIFGSVGIPPIKTEEEITAWINYVKAFVKHFKDKVKYYEIWNEPDNQNCWRHGVNATEYGIFAIKTAKVIREFNSDAKIIGGATCYINLKFLNEALATGMYDYIDMISFHEYTCKEASVMDRIKSLQALCDSYKKGIEIVSGETGTQSKPYGSGALKEGAWTEHLQTKFLLRHKGADVLNNVKFTSYFSSLDMIEALHGNVDDRKSCMDFAYFGLLRADFDENGCSTGKYSPKPSYYAYQNLCSIFSGEFRVENLPIQFHKEPARLHFDTDCSDRTIISGGVKRENGSSAFIYWNSLPLMTYEYSGTVSLLLANLNKNIKLIDPYDGSIYTFPKEMLMNIEPNAYYLKNIPIKDYPLILTFGDFLL